MKGLGNLIKNELIKTGKAVYFKIFVILILVASIGLPTAFFIIDKIDEKNNNISWEVDYYNNFAETAVEKAYYGCYKEAADFFGENSILKDSWRYTDYFDAYASIYCARVKAFDMLAKGEASYSELNNYFYYVLDGSSLSEPVEDLNAVTDSTIFDNTSSDEEFTYEGLSTQEYEKLRDEAQKDKEKVAEYIKNAKISDKYQNLVKIAQENVNQAKEYLNACKADCDKTKSIDDKRTLADAENAYEMKNVILWSYQQLLDGKYNEDDWHYDEVANTLSVAVNSISGSALYDEDIFNKATDLLTTYKSYKRYLISNEPKFKSVEKTINAVKYSFEKNLPLSLSETTSAGAYLLTQMEITSIVICLFMIIMAGTSISNEFVSGSVRLLLIRPRSRTRILLSKILAVFIYGGALMLASLILMSILNMGFCETKNLFSREILVGMTGKPYVGFPLLQIFFRCILDLFSINVMVSLTVLIAVLFTRGGVLAVTFPLIIQIIGILSSSRFNSINCKMYGLFEYTAIPYLRLSGYLDNPLADFFSDVGYVESLQNAFSAVTGIAVIVITSAVLYFISFLVFKKKQIKN